MKALTLALLISIAPPPLEPCQVYQAQKRYEFIEEHNLQRVYLSCYLPTGYNCADGTPPVEGVVSSNREHLGMDCIVYDDSLTAMMRLECRDVGGHKMLKDGTAIDVFRNDMSRALELREEYGDHVWIEWIPREEADDGQGD